MTTRTTRVPRIALVACVGAWFVLATAACGFFGDDEAGPEAPPATPTPSPSVSEEPTPEPTPVVQWPELGTARITTDDLNVRVGPGTHYEVLGRLDTGAEVPISGRAQGQRWLALPQIGWIAYDADWMELSLDFDDLPHIPPDQEGYEFVGPVHPTGTVIDIPVVDTVIGVVERGDRGAMARLAAGAEEPEESFVPGGPCPQAIHPASELETNLDQFFQSEATGAGDLRLYAVIRDPLRLSPPQNDLVDFIAVFAFEGGEGRQLWISPHGDITWFSFGCDAPERPGELLRLNGGEPFYWFRPVAPAPLRPI